MSTSKIEKRAIGLFAWRWNYTFRDAERMWKKLSAKTMLVYLNQVKKIEEYVNK